jgi:hypothetical protein
MFTVSSFFARRHVMEATFGVLNLVVLPFWLAMMVAPGWRRTEQLMASRWGLLAPVIAALAYLAMVLPRLPAILPVVARPELPAVAALLGTPAGAAIGWAHFLAFDLLVGRWIYLDGRQRRVSSWLLSPILLLTLLLGPLGLLAYGAVLAARRVPTGGLDRPLTLLALGAAGLMLASAALMLVDPRQVLGASTWLKPLKFGMSVALMSFTLALLLKQLPPLGRGGRTAVSVSAGLLALELVIITAQAARGVPSHFNASSLVNLVLFNIMGAAIVVVTALLGYLGWRSFRTPIGQFDSAALGWGVRLGFVLLVAGASLGALMPTPTAQQRRELRSGAHPALLGAHAVGVPDGGPGLPLTRWSTEGGDLRIPHFAGMHGLQLLPLVGWWLGRRRSSRTPAGARTASRRVQVAAAGHAGLVGVLLLQALRGQPLLAPDALTLATLATLLVGIATTWWLVGRPRYPAYAPTPPLPTTT